METEKITLKQARKKILIVDSELNILKLLGYILSPDYDVCIKTNAVTALQWLSEGNDPDLIISSLYMPYIDGKSFIQNLKVSGYYKNTPVIVLSGEEDLATILQSFSFKVDAYIGKPFNPIQLKSNIENLIAYRNA